MLHIPEIVAALQAQHVAAAEIAKLYPAGGEQLLDGYNIKLTEPPVREVIIGLQRGRHTLALPPEEVTLFFTEPLSIAVSQAAPFCTQWEEAPNSRLRPWFYACRVRAQGRVPLIVFASLSGDIHDPQTRLRELVIRKDL